MGKGLRDFVVQDHRGFGTYDMESLSGLSPEEFRKKYIEEMRTYFDNHDRPTIKCWECPEEITSPEDLIRRYGANLHLECFKEVHSRKRERGGHAQEYFDLILASLEV